MVETSGILKVSTLNFALGNSKILFNVNQQVYRFLEFALSNPFFEISTVVVLTDIRISTVIVLSDIKISSNVD